MCPICITTLGLAAAGTASGALGLIAAKRLRNRAGAQKRRHRPTDPRPEETRR